MQTNGADRFVHCTVFKQILIHSTDCKTYFNYIMLFTNLYSINLITFSLKLNVIFIFNLYAE